MKVLISPKDEFEAKAAVDGGADIIDVKNPDEGSLGANFPWVIRQVRNLVPQSIEVSATIGDFPHLPGSASLAALGAAVSGANYVKVGLKGSKTLEEAFFLMHHVTRAVKEYDLNTKVVLAGYADYHRAETLDPFLLPEVARSAGCDVVMVDTFIKDGKRLFDFMDEASCKRFIEKGHEQDLEVALAGSIKLPDIAILKRIGADIIGIRGAACSHGDRLAGTIQAENVKALMDLAKQPERPLCRLENYYFSRCHVIDMSVDYAALSDKLTSVLGLKGSPVAVKLLRTESSLPKGLVHTNEVLRHCEMVQKARSGSKFYATVEQHACKGGAGMLGVIDIPENIKSGEFYYKLGRFSSIEHAAETMQDIPHVDFKTYATAYSPLAETPFDPDVVVLVVTPHQAMMIAQANVYELHSRNTADFSGIQSICGDAVAAPLMRGTVNFTLGCSGSRKYAKVSEDELIVGIPMKMLPKLADAIQKLT